MPLFSIIIPTYNRCHLTKLAVDSVLNQTFKDFELIVIDDGSTDNTESIKHEYNGKLKYIKQNNQGVSSARNKGIHNSNARYIAFLDSDDLWLPTKLEEQNNYIKTKPDIKIHQTDELWIRNNVRVNPKIKHIKKEGFIFNESLHLCLISPSAVVINRELFELYGYFDELMPACEDYDLWLRITLHEKVGLIKKGLIVKHGGHDDQLSKRYWGMDRFRIYSIIKLLKNNKVDIRPEYKNNAKNIALEKLQILIQGCKKRNRSNDIVQLLKIKEMIHDESYSSIDYQILLEI